MTDRVFQHDGLTLAVVHRRSTTTITWKGASNSRAPGQFLNPVIHELSASLKNGEVTIDLRPLEYMNSATVMPLINLVKRLDANGNAVRVVLLDVEWQRTHGNCMSAIARTLKNVRVERDGPAQPDSSKVALESLSRLASSTSKGQ